MKNILVLASLILVVVSTAALGQMAGGNRVTIVHRRWLMDADSVTLNNITDTFFIGRDSLLISNTLKGVVKNSVGRKIDVEKDGFIVELKFLSTASWSDIAQESRKACCDTVKSIVVFVYDQNKRYVYAIRNGEEFCQYPDTIKDFMKKLFRFLYQ